MALKMDGTPKRRPTCKKCGGVHPGFVSCDKADDHHQVVADNKRVAANKAHFEIQWQPSQPVTWESNPQVRQPGFHRNEFRENK